MVSLTRQYTFTMSVLVIISVNGRHTDLLLPGGRAITKASDDAVLLWQCNERKVVTPVKITLCAAATSGEAADLEQHETNEVRERECSKRAVLR